MVHSHVGFRCDVDHMQIKVKKNMSRCVWIGAFQSHRG